MFLDLVFGMYPWPGCFVYLWHITGHRVTACRLRVLKKLPDLDWCFRVSCMQCGIETTMDWVFVAPEWFRIEDAFRLRMRCGPCLRHHFLFEFDQEFRDYQRRSLGHEPEQGGGDFGPPVRCSVRPTLPFPFPFIRYVTWILHSNQDPRCLCSLCQDARKRGRLVEAEPVPVPNLVLVRRLGVAGPVPVLIDANSDEGMRYLEASSSDVLVGYG